MTMSYCPPFLFVLLIDLLNYIIDVVTLIFSTEGSSEEDLTESGDEDNESTEEKVGHNLLIA